MLLETSLGQKSAIRLYRGLGFSDIAAYNELPEAVRASMRHMELVLSQRDA